LLEIKSQPTAAKAAKAAPYRVERETALTRTSVDRFNKEDVVGKEHNSSSYSFDTDDNNDEFPSLDELLRRPLHIKNSLKRAYQLLVYSLEDAWNGDPECGGCNVDKTKNSKRVQGASGRLQSQQEERNWEVCDACNCRKYNKIAW
jgi:hypothetical protein